MPPTPDVEKARPGAPEVKGWCPGAFRPMASNDGLLIRAKLVGSRIAASQLAEVAKISAACGNGLVDLSQRAQLQIRGVSETTLAEALRRLATIDMLAPDADAERVTNIVASPLAGLSANAALDANALARELATALQEDPSLRALPAKFLFAIDDGGPLPLANVEADILISASAGGCVAVMIAGAKGRAAICGRRDAVASAAQLARAFIVLRDGVFELRRMRRLVSIFGADRLFGEAGLVAQSHERAHDGARPGFLGARETDGAVFAGLAAPFGRWRAAELSGLAALAESCGVGELRVTPWRAFLIPTETIGAARRAVDAARAGDLVVSHDDPRLAVAACPGAPECPQGRGETRAHLARLAPLAQKLAGKDGVGLHISGCAKGCARPGAAPVTLVADQGGFDLVEHGRAHDAPQLKGLDLDAVERALAMRAEEKKCPTP